jgi:hypothetical protein
MAGAECSGGMLCMKWDAISAELEKMSVASSKIRSGDEKRLAPR